MRSFARRLKLRRHFYRLNQWHTFTELHLRHVNEPSFYDGGLHPIFCATNFFDAALGSDPFCQPDTVNFVLLGDPEDAGVAGTSLALGSETYLTILVASGVAAVDLKPCLI